MAGLRSTTMVLLILGVLATGCKGLMPCANHPESCSEYKHQQCEDTDYDGRPDTCLCVSPYYLRIISCHELPAYTGEGEGPVPPCKVDNPCQNNGQCMYNATIRHMSCTCVPPYTGLRCETGLECGLGEYLDEGTKACAPCPLGTYKAHLGTQPCTTCPLGPGNRKQVTQAEGSTSPQDCMPGPYIESFTAPYGPLAGGTVVDITVEEVPGFYVSNITHITVAGVTCPTHNAAKDLSQNMSQCMTLPVRSVRSGPVVLTIRGINFISTAEFAYRENPVITNINRNKTIDRGGLKMKVSGENLNSVFTPLITITVTQGKLKDIAKSECAVVSKEMMECPTPDLHNLTPLEDEEEGVVPSSTTSKSTTTSLKSTTTPRTNPPTPAEETPLGERPPEKKPIEEMPQREVPVEKPIEEKPIEEKPIEEVSTTVHPQGEGRRRKREVNKDYGNHNDWCSRCHFWLGFELDGEDHYKNVSEVLPYGEIRVYRTPEPVPLYGKDGDPQEVYYHDYDFHRGILNIKGHSLDLGCYMDDYIVEIGEGYCNVTALYSNSLHCRLPPILPKPQPDRKGGPKDIPSLTVHVGNLHNNLGYIAYKTGGPSREVIIGIIIGIIVVIILVFTMVVIYCVMRRRMKGKDKNANLQMVAIPNPNIYSDGLNPARQRADPRMRNGYLQPVHQVNGYNNSNGTPRSSVSGNSLTPLMIPMPDNFGQNGYYLDGQGTPTTPTTPNMAKNVAYQIPRHNSIPFEIMDCISEDLRLIIDECKVDSQRLQLKDSIGKGFFGKVYRGTFTDESGKVETTVAIKTIQGKECTVKDVEAFLAEAIVMKDCHHDNVLSLLGVVIAGNRPFAILPYMEHGDLKSYIAEPERSIKVRELLGFGVQVAAGMEYLTGQKIVHRDLATRNCMINKVLTVRIADFGLSRDIYKSDYYRVEDKHRPLPVKWMAIESLTGGVFTTSSDVWSFGVLLWELLTRGCPPYPDIDTFNLKNYLLSGRRLVQPEHAPDEVYDIMSSCWLERPDDRPNFTQLKEKLSNIVEEDEENMTPEYLKLI